jgi:hypothetical protein
MVDPEIIWILCSDGESAAWPEAVYPAARAARAVAEQIRPTRWRPMERDLGDGWAQHSADGRWLIRGLVLNEEAGGCGGGKSADQ